MAVKVFSPGLATTVQDRGRLGYYDVGIPPGGSLSEPIEAQPTATPAD